MSRTDRRFENAVCPTNSSRWVDNSCMENSKNTAQQSHFFFICTTSVMRWDRHLAMLPLRRDETRMPSRQLEVQILTGHLRCIRFQIAPKQLIRLFLSLPTLRPQLLSGLRALNLSTRKQQSIQQKNFLFHSPHLTLTTAFPRSSHCRHRSRGARACHWVDVSNAQGIRTLASVSSTAGPFSSGDAISVTPINCHG